ncbi:UNVERIFIED_CONTAM: hypothetical protein HHA_312210 [Hammondia hammondi]|eukprot:XP_008885804.1 hypothetical protein HHA_312210 [Hammondia hammondi]
MMVLLLSASSHVFGTSAARSLHPRVGFSVPLKGSFHFSSFSGSSPFPHLFAASSAFRFSRVSRPSSCSPPCSSLAPHSSLLFCSACAGSWSRVFVCGSGVFPLSFRFFSTNYFSSFPSNRQVCSPAATRAVVSSVGAPLRSTASCRVAACSVPRPLFSSISPTSCRSDRPFESPTFLASFYGASGEARLFSGRPTTPNREPADATRPSKQKLPNSPCVVCMYTATGCSLCDKAIFHVRRLLRGLSVPAVFVSSSYRVEQIASQSGFDATTNCPAAATSRSAGTAPFPALRFPRACETALQPADLPAFAASLPKNTARSNCPFRRVASGQSPATSPKKPPAVVCVVVNLDRLPPCQLGATFADDSEDFCLCHDSDAFVLLRTEDSSRLRESLPVVSVDGRVVSTLQLNARAIREAIETSLSRKL